MSWRNASKITDFSAKIAIPVKNFDRLKKRSAFYKGTFIVFKRFSAPCAGAQEHFSVFFQWFGRNLAPV